MIGKTQCLTKHPIMFGSVPAAVNCRCFEHRQIAQSDI
jgi:hypothetical protein